MTDAIPLAVVFVDVCGSTSLYAREGDDRAAQAVTETLAILRSVTEEHGGTVVKLTGDGILCTFPTADEAFRTATRLQVDHGNQLLPIKLALHYGPVVLKDGDVYGDTVNVSARLCDQAEKGEILLSADANTALSESLKGQTRVLYHKALKGKTEPIAIYGFVREEDEGVTDLADSELPDGSEQPLLLVYSGKHYSVSPQCPRLLLGRGEECDVVLDDHRVSRQHAVVQLQQSNYYMQDQSTNGTYLLMPDDTVLRIRRESTPLLSSGGISPGRDPRQNEKNVIWFRHGHPGSTA